MKTIKFRVWDGKKLHYPEATKDESNHYLQFGTNGFWLFNEKGKMVTASEVSGECNQFTGFKDKNGKEIYEGDIIGDWTKTEEGLKQSKQQVFWFEKEGCWKLDNSFFQNKSNCQNLYSELRDYEFEVLGNIYENPELLVNDLNVDFETVKPSNKK